MNENENTLWRDHMLKAYRRIRGNRAYALDDQSALPLTALCRAWQEQRASEGINFDADQLVEFLEHVAQEIPELLQSRPGEPEPLPPLPCDPSPTPPQ